MGKTQKQNNTFNFQVCFCVFLKIKNKNSLFSREQNTNIFKQDVYTAVTRDAPREQG